MYSRNDEIIAAAFSRPSAECTGEQELVLGHLVDRLLVGLADIEDGVAQVGVGGQRFQCLGEHRRWRSRRGRLIVGDLPGCCGGGDLLVGIERVHEIVGDGAQVGASREIA